MHLMNSTSTIKTISVNKLKRMSLQKIILNSPIALVEKETLVAYLISAEQYEFLIEQMENEELSKVIIQRKDGETIKLNIISL